MKSLIIRTFLSVSIMDSHKGSGHKTEKTLLGSFLLLLLFQINICEIKWRAKSNFCLNFCFKKKCQKNPSPKTISSDITKKRNELCFNILYDVVDSHKKMLHFIGHSALHQYYAMVTLSSWHVSIMADTQLSEPIKGNFLVKYVTLVPSLGNEILHNYAIPFLLLLQLLYFYNLFCRNLMSDGKSVSFEALV